MEKEGEMRVALEKKKKGREKSFFFFPQSELLALVCELFARFFFFPLKTRRNLHPSSSSSTRVFPRSD